MDSLQEMYQLYDLCIYYFSDVWQIAMSIGLSECYQSGVWFDNGEPIRKFTKFATFIKTKFQYTVDCYKGEFGTMPLRDFLQQQRAQSNFRFEPLESVTIPESKFFLFTGKSVQALGVPLRTFKSLNSAAFKPKGGTRKRKSVKTRRQKRR
jgi:hypothetical protein